MPPRRYSRHSYTSGIADAAGRVRLSDRVPFRFVDLPDNRIHVVRDGETLWTIAARLFVGVAAPTSPASLWWVIADFQPDPIFDPTLRLTPGALLVVPSMRTVLESILSERRRAEHRPG